MVPRATNTKNFETDFKVFSQSRKFEFNIFSILHITFDVLDRFQENKVFKTAQIINGKVFYRDTKVINGGVFISCISD